jgi:hypothetical protein
VAGSEEDTASRLPYPDDVTGSRCAHDAILADQELLDAIGSADLGNGLSDLWIPVAAVTTDDEERVLDAFRN